MQALYAITVVETQNIKTLFILIVHVLKMAVRLIGTICLYSAPPPRQENVRHTQYGLNQFITNQTVYSRRFFSLC